jgi:hypothetical protein
MALTDKSAVPLSVHDLRVIDGKPRFNDGRIAIRLSLDRRDWRQLIKRHEQEAVECGLGNLLHRATNYYGAGRPSEDWFLTISQTVFYSSFSDTKNVRHVVAEAALVMEAVQTGAPIPSTPWTDALFASDVPTVTRRDDSNIVTIGWKQPLLPLDEQPVIKQTHLAAAGELDDDEDDAKARGIWSGRWRTWDSLTHDYRWIVVSDAGLDYELIIRVWSGTNVPFLLSIKQVRETFPSADRRMKYQKLLVCADKHIPLEVANNALTRLQVESKFSAATLASIKRWMCNDRPTLSST